MRNRTCKIMYLIQEHDRPLRPVQKMASSGTGACPMPSGSDIGRLLMIIMQRHRANGPSMRQRKQSNYVATSKCSPDNIASPAKS
jgi:hypothetical protein